MLLEQAEQLIGQQQQRQNGSHIESNLQVYQSADSDQMKHNADSGDLHVVRVVLSRRLHNAIIGCRARQTMSSLSDDESLIDNNYGSIQSSDNTRDELTRIHYDNTQNGPNGSDGARQNLFVPGGILNGFAQLQGKLSRWFGNRNVMNNMSSSDYHQAGNSDADVNEPAVKASARYVSSTGDGPISDAKSSSTNEQQNHVIVLTKWFRISLNREYRT